MIVTDEDNINFRESRESNARRMCALGAYESEGRAPLAPNGVGENMHSTNVYQKSAVVYPLDRGFNRRKMPLAFWVGKGGGTTS